MYAFLYIYSVYLKFILLSKFDFCELLWAWAFLKFLADLKKKVESESEHALKKSIKIAYIIQTLNLELTSELWIVQSLLVLTFDFRIWTTMITCGFRVVARVLSLSTKVERILSTSASTALLGNQLKFPLITTARSMSGVRYLKF